MRKPETDTEQSSECEAQTIKAAVKQQYIAPTIEECPAIEAKLFRTRHNKDSGGAEQREFLGKSR